VPRRRRSSAHQALLEDPEFLDRVETRVRRSGSSAERAVRVEVAELGRKLGSASDRYLRERAVDVRDVGRRLLGNLVPHALGAVNPLPPGSVVVAAELLPSETVDLDRAHVSAIVTELAGETGHVAILARGLGIPAVTGIEGATRCIPPGAWVLVDGERGEVTVAPSKERASGFAVRQRAWNRSSAAAETEEATECITRDGEPIGLLANIGRLEETPEVRRHHLKGVGLFRTEFLFLESPEPPSVERHALVYEQTARDLAGLPVTVRTLDLGGDKVPRFLAGHSERNPSLGLRGLQFSLRERELLAAQLEALADAGRVGEFRVMFPMVIGSADLREAKRRLHEAESRVQGARRLQVGAMVETPAAVFAIDEILAEVDFVSLGTNDLTQFVLAADRDALEWLDAYSVLHPSVLRAVARVVQAARGRGVPISVCGEAAGEPSSAALLVGLGVRELSMSPMRAARVRYALRRVECRACEDLATAALAADSVEEVRALVGDLLDSVVIPSS
jgi:phosphoenolpyruvate-protein phosphotransferase (PTS system enzyme I)